MTPSPTPPSRHSSGPAVPAAEQVDELDELFTREGTHDGMDAELGGWVYDTLQKLQPGVEISVGSVKVRAKLIAAIFL
jgi:hypothetical protein